MSIEHLTDTEEHRPKEFVIGRPYHLSWARNRGMVWILRHIDELTGKCVLETPRTRKKIYSDTDSLRNTNKNLGK